MKKLDEASTEINKRRKKRAIKVAITEGLMVLVVVLMVGVTTLLAIGYNVNPESGTVERAGLVQIQSLPTGANVTLDGESIFGWTNLSRSMVEGEHEISISRDGYDSWSKKIFVTAGLYYRLNYPRLFLTEKKIEKIADFSGARIVSFAKDGNLMLMAKEGSATWQILKINEDKPTTTEVNLEEVFPELSLEAINKAEVKAWSGNNERVLLFVDGEWLIFDVKRPTESVNLSEEFGLNFSEVKIANDAATELFVLENGNLRLISLNEEKISEAVVVNVSYFDNLKRDVVYVTEADEEGNFATGIYRAGEKGGTVISEFFDPEFETGKNVKVMIGEYYGEYYVMEVVGSQMGVYRGESLPSFGDESELSAVSVEELGFVPEKLEVTGGGGLFTAVSGNERATFDVETMKTQKWSNDFELRWLDEHMVYGVFGGELFVFDFDGENRREIVGSANPETEVKISKNNKWMYFVDNQGEFERVVIN